MLDSRDYFFVECEDCHWRGRLSECEHKYRMLVSTGGDVEPEDRCPKCGSYNLIEIDSIGEKVGVRL